MPMPVRNRYRTIDIKGKGGGRSTRRKTRRRRSQLAPSSQPTSQTVGQLGAPGRGVEIIEINEIVDFLLGEGKAR